MFDKSVNGIHDTCSRSSSFVYGIRSSDVQFQVPFEFYEIVLLFNLDREFKAYIDHCFTVTK